jgi:dipeptidyl aminopeptidase/acylaminoacyl peptidase
VAPVAPPPPPAGSASTGVSRVIDATPDVPLGKREVRDAELAEAAGKIVDAYTNSEPMLSRDGKRLVFVSNRDGLPQLYAADPAKPESPATRLFSTTERVGGARLTPDGSAILFTSDHGADENFSIFKVNADGSNLVELTPDTKLRREQLFISDAKPDTVFYTGRAMSSAGTTIYSASTKGPAGEKVVWKDDLPASLADVDRQGTRGIAVRYPSHDDNQLIAVDLVAGTGKQIYPPTGQKVTIYDAAMSRDGKRVYVGTDEGGEKAVFLALDPATGKELARYVETKPATAAIAGIAIAKAGNTAVVRIDAGNHDEIRLLDATTLKPKATVDIPLGSGNISGFSDDGKRLLVQWSTPAAPLDIFSIDVATGKVTPLRKDVRPGFESMPSVEASIVSIDAFGGGKIPVNIYLPSGAQNKKLPVIVSFHGGPTGSSAIRWSALSRFYLAQGYAWVEPNVRGSSGFGRAYAAADDGPKRLDAFKDIETSGTWAAAQPWADKDRVVIFGGSYGGYTVLIGLTRQPTLWRAGVDLFGVVNMKTFMATTSGVIRKLFLVEFGDPDKDAAFLDSISPLHDVNKIARPLFVYAGANDPRVPRAEDDQIVIALRTRGIPVEYMVKDDEGHSLVHRANIIEFLARSARFLEHQLK